MKVKFHHSKVLPVIYLSWRSLILTIKILIMFEKQQQLSQIIIMII